MDKVKENLLSAPVLAFYDANKPLRLTADGSQKSIGAVLSHVE
jgi:RNase H-like domain found in reverse transcriptase